MSANLHPSRPPAVVLLSGGLDSITALGVAKRDGFCPHAMTFQYGQRNRWEVDSARKIASAMAACAHVVVDIDPAGWGASALTGQQPVEKNRDLDSSAADIPNTYVPARNTIFLSFATAWAEVLGARAIYIGVNVLDYSGYPDCRPEFIEAFEKMANLATRAGTAAASDSAHARGARLSICAPLQHLTKAEIIELGSSLGVDYSLTTSCYDPPRRGVACGECDACQLRLRAFREIGIDDPIEYASGLFEPPPVECE